jgi:1-acyl-sn-glycerol-3-phosphate acyltransferase
VQDWKLEPARDLGLSLDERHRSLRRESGLIQTAAHLGWWSLMRVYLGVAHRLTIHGRERLPREPPFVLVANHTSHLDALVLAAPLPWRLRDRIFPVAAGDTFFETPVTAAFAAVLLNALPLWRKHCGRHALEELKQRLLEEPCGYILFPEGTRSRDGTLGRFKFGLGSLVAGTTVPVIPCHLQGAYEAWPPDRRRPRFGRITMRVGEPLLFSTATDDRTGWKEVAATAEAAVRRLGEGTVPGRS